ncbi:hypothetical protein PYCCODRAFT_1463127 [Trametes coccinea BRFM310]|uniref:Uncharacterized protein n=1 Tax=Trametes coccinea (strain BRFM310) TaxID=1353009 RepID=A0A1Y2J6I5_TRAC3|nr:hypothetical protein PYCCODRAFT_1463127 [Trametes coccinea BRFM310]
MPLLSHCLPPTQAPTRPFRGGGDKLQTPVVMAQVAALAVVFGPQLRWLHRVLRTLFDGGFGNVADDNGTALVRVLGRDDRDDDAGLTIASVGHRLGRLLGDDDWAIHLGEPAAEPVSAHVVLTANLAFAPHNVLRIVILALVLAFIAVHARVHVLVGFANGPAHRPDIAIVHQQWTYHERFRHFDFDRDRTNKLANVWLKHKLAW